jgi:hypothetical protein
VDEKWVKERIKEGHMEMKNKSSDIAWAEEGKEKEEWYEDEEIE